MFEWNVEELALRATNRKDKWGKGHHKIFPCEETLSREDKIEFVDRMNNGALSNILALAEKWNIEKVGLPKTQFGSVNANSVKKWIRINDTCKVLKSDDITYYLLGYTGSLNSNNTGHFSCWEDVVDELFHRQLSECLNAETTYFRAHDEYEILKTKLREYEHRHNTNFGVSLSFCSDGKILVYADSTNYKPDREITIEELKILIDKYERLEAYIAELTAETHITY